MTDTILPHTGDPKANVEDVEQIEMKANIAHPKLEHAKEEANQEELLAALAERIMPGTQLNQDPKFEAALVRKLDYRLLVMLMAIYIMNYLDRGNIAFAAIGTLKQDLGLTSVQYSTSISILYVGYLTIQIPSNMIVAKVRPSLFIPMVMVIWGAVNACMGAVQSYGGLMACRFILGIVEAPYFAAALYLLSCFYTKKELSSRIAILYSASMLSGAFGGLLASAITSGMDGKAGLAAWRWLYIIEGSMTIPVAAIAFFVLPDYPDTTRWFNDEEKKLAIYRIASQNFAEGTSAVNMEMTMLQALKAAVVDPATWLILFTQTGLTSASTFSNFFPTIIATLGYSRIISYLLTAPPYAFIAIVTIINSFHADKKGERYFHIIWGQFGAIIGFIIAASTLVTGARYTSMFLMMLVYGGFAPILSWIQTSTPNPPLKKAVVYAIVNAVSNLASVYGSYLYPSDQGPRYLRAQIANIGFSCFCVVMATIFRFYLKHLNKKLDKAEEIDLQNEGKPIGTESTKLLKRLMIEPTYRYML